MQLKTILNRVYGHKSFVYQEGKISEDGNGACLLIPVEARKNGKAVCSGCGQRRPGYDHLQARRFQFVPVWGLALPVAGGWVVVEGAVDEIGAAVACPPAIE